MIIKEFDSVKRYNIFLVIYLFINCAHEMKMSLRENMSI